MNDIKDYIGEVVRVKLTNEDKHRVGRVYAIPGDKNQSYVLFVFKILLGFDAIVYNREAFHSFAICSPGATVFLDFGSGPVPYTTPSLNEFDGYISRRKFDTQGSFAQYMKAMTDIEDLQEILDATNKRETIKTVAGDGEKINEDGTLVNPTGRFEFL